MKNFRSFDCNNNNRQQKWNALLNNHFNVHNFVKFNPFSSRLSLSLFIRSLIEAYNFKAINSKRQISFEFFFWSTRSTHFCSKYARNECDVTHTPHTSRAAVWLCERAWKHIFFVITTSIELGFGEYQRRNQKPVKMWSAKNQSRYYEFWH